MASQIFEIIYNLWERDYMLAQVVDETGLPEELIAEVASQLGVSFAQYDLGQELEQFLVQYDLRIDPNHKVNGIVLRPVLLDKGYLDKRELQREALKYRDENQACVFIYPNDLADVRIRTILGQHLQCAQNHIRIGARQCEIKLVSLDMLKSFLNAYHLQGFLSRYGASYGLYYKQELVSVMCVGESRFKRDEWEIIRYCPHPAYAISGGFRKLLNAAVADIADKANRLVSYMDLNKRFVAQDVYAKNGFENTGVTIPDYVWSTIDGSDVRSRYACMKHKLVALGFPSDKTEREIMLEQGFVQVFGAGSLRYELTW